MKKLLFTILFVFSLMSICYADFSIEIQNPTNTKMYFKLFWINHPFNYLHPFAMSGGELLPQKTFKLSDKYSDKTQWAIQWDSDKKPWIKFFSVPAGASKVIIEYKKIIIERGV